MRHELATVGRFRVEAPLEANEAPAATEQPLYAAAKAAADLVALSCVRTFRQPMLMRPASNALRSASPEKVIRDDPEGGERLPVYGDGLQVL